MIVKTFTPEYDLKVFVMNLLRQARRFDPAGQYVRRYVPELSGLDPAAIQTPWKLPAAQRRQLGYPDPIVELS